MNNTHLRGLGGQTGLWLQFLMPADWQRIEPLRQAIAMCAAAMFSDPDLQDRIAMVSAELLENAVKHGQTNQISFSLHEEKGGLLVTVCNAVSPESSKVATLRARLSWIGGFPEPQAAYLAAMAQVYARGEAATGSELGLVRVAYEGGCRIECDTSQAGWVTVQARYELPVAKAA